MTMVYYFLFFFSLSAAYAKIYFKEEFLDDSWDRSWSYSEHPSKEWGKFVLTPGKYYGDFNISKGIQTTEDDQFYALFTKFEPFSNKDKVLVVQFTVKHEQDIHCGGGYLKIFDCSLKPKTFHMYTPYLIMFGPDICGAHKNVKVIFNYKDKNLEMKRKIECKSDHFTHLYTLIVKPDNTYVVKIDNKIEREGNLEEDFDFLPPRKIKDLKATKPIDWEDNPKIEDPNAKKPGNHDQPEFIPNANNAQTFTAKEAGDNSTPLLKSNLDGSKWNPKVIDNSKGFWSPPLIDNPSYVADPYLYKYDEICGVGFDIFQVKSGTIFDNILISDDEFEAEKHGNDSWAALKEKEKLMKIKIRKGAYLKDPLSETKTIRHDEF